MISCLILYKYGLKFTTKKQLLIEDTKIDNTIKDYNINDDIDNISLDFSINNISQREIPESLDPDNNFKSLYGETN